MPESPDQYLIALDRALMMLVASAQKPGVIGIEDTPEMLLTATDCASSNGPGTARVLEKLSKKAFALGTAGLA